MTSSPTSQPLPLRSMGRERKGFIRVGHLAYTRRAAKQLVSPASSHQPATNAPPLSVTLLLSSIHDAPVTWSPRPWPMDSGCRALAYTTSRRTRTHNAATTRSRQPSNPATQHPNIPSPLVPQNRQGPPSAMPLSMSVSTTFHQRR